MSKNKSKRLLLFLFSVNTIFLSDPLFSYQFIYCPKTVTCSDDDYLKCTFDDPTGVFYYSSDLLDKNGGTYVLKDASYEASSLGQSSGCYYKLYTYDKPDGYHISLMSSVKLYPDINQNTNWRKDVFNYLKCETDGDPLVCPFT